MSKFSEYFNLKYSKLSEKKLTLTSTQLCLLKLLASGSTLQEIALMCGKKYENIKKRTNNLYKKFKVQNRLDLVRKAIKADLIKTGDVTVRFKKRFIKDEFLHDACLCQNLTEEEIRYLYLVSIGKTQREIVCIMNFYGIYPAQYIRKCICLKLNCKNMTQAVRTAFILKIIK